MAGWKPRLPRRRQGSRRCAVQGSAHSPAHSRWHSCRVLRSREEGHRGGAGACGRGAGGPQCAVAAARFVCVSNASPRRTTCSPPSHGCTHTSSRWNPRLAPSPLAPPIGTPPCWPARSTACPTRQCAPSTRHRCPRQPTPLLLGAAPPLQLVSPTESPQWQCSASTCQRHRCACTIDSALRRPLPWTGSGRGCARTCH